MLVKDLQPFSKVEEIELTLTEKKDPREFTGKFGNSGTVCNAQGTDSEGGTIVLTLWNEDSEKFQVGDKIKITDGYAKEYRGELQLSAGKYGKMEKLE